MISHNIFESPYQNGWSESLRFSLPEAHASIHYAFIHPPAPQSSPSATQTPGPVQAYFQYRVQFRELWAVTPRVSTRVMETREKGDKSVQAFPRGSQEIVAVITQREYNSCSNSAPEEDSSLPCRCKPVTIYVSILRSFCDLTASLGVNEGPKVWELFQICN